jgi:hypothetical protein
MNEQYDKINQNRYEGNGWSKYQLMVLQQLEDHHKVLQNLNKELIDLKQSLAVSETELKMWRTQTMVDVEDLTKNLSHILHDERGLSRKLLEVERQLNVEEQVATRTRANWAFYSAILIFFVNILFVQLFCCIVRLTFVCWYL